MSPSRKSCEDLEVFAGPLRSREQEEGDIDRQFVYRLERDRLFQDHQSREWCFQAGDRRMWHGNAMPDAGRAELFSAEQGGMDRAFVKARARGGMGRQFLYQVGFIRDGEIKDHVLWFDDR